MFRPVTLTTARLTLRPLSEVDAFALFAIWSDFEAMRYFSFPPMTCIDQATERLSLKIGTSAQGDELIFALELETTGEVIGDCALFNGDERNRRAEIGFSLARQQWGYGYMSEAATALLDHAFNTLDLRRIEGDVDPHNMASIRLLERLGFVREGLARERWMVEGRVSDNALYGLLPSDFRKPAFTSD